MGNESKRIRKTDDSAMALLFEIIGDKANKVADIDSYYNINDTYHFLEFIKCDINPFEYDLNNQLNVLHKELSIIWDFSQRAGGVLWLVYYNTEKIQFKINKVDSLNDKEIKFSEEINLSFEEFKNWFQKMNSDVLKGK